MELGNNFLQKIAEAISEITSGHVTITDEHNVRIAGTGPYSKLISHKVPIGSAFRQVKETKETLVVNNPVKDPICHGCINVKRCIEKYEICVPIISKDKVIGVMGIFAVNEDEARFMRSKERFFVQFALSMAELFSSYKSEQELLKTLKFKNEELSIIIENSTNGLICVDSDLRIVYINKKAISLLSLDGIDYSHMTFDCIWRNSPLEKSIKENMEYKNRRDLYEHKYKHNNKVLISTIKHVRNENGFLKAIWSFQDASILEKEVISYNKANVVTTFGDLIGCSKSITSIKNRAKISAVNDSNILIIGESGTGKELFARAIHQFSPRKNGPFISINCSAIPDSLFESELFGYEPGAFTGAAKKGKVGKMELADGGTLFLDEIGDMPLHIQPKLLRAIQERKIYRVGGVKVRNLDIRIISATNKNLEQLVKDKEFREDLYYRLNVIPIKIPPLRNRKEDIPVLVEKMLEYYNDKFSINIKGISDETMEVLMNYDWPGNVRELENVMEYACNFSRNSIIKLEDLKGRLRNGVEEGETLEEKVKLYEKKIINEALTIYGNDMEGKKQAAESLGISIATLYRKLS